MNYLECATRLCLAPGPSGFERPAAAVAGDLMRPYVDEVRTDRLGNVIGIRRCGKAGAKKILLDAHLDEVGMIVASIEEGFLHITPLGGIDPRILQDRELTILSDPPVLGVVAVKPPHIMEAGEHNQATPMKDLWVDIGMSQEEAEKIISIGTPVVYRENIYRLGKDLIAGKSLDDRSCFLTLVRALEILKDEELDMDVAVLGSAFEEVGGYGAMTATFAENPDCAIATDVTFARTNDGPSRGCVKLGEGPTVGIGSNCSRWMVNRLRKVGKELDIKWNPEIMPGETGTNGWGMQVAREGIPTAIVSLPLRYMHTPIEVVSEADMEKMAQLLAGFIRGLGEEEALCSKN
ncbi:MAG: M20/M25/M40 family metallo-hydrolase [Oscillospiraceae bacterium]|nr:M20/M25/M40 family metallo-hydrolase [Oscillospiraceae bacterium]